MKEKELHTIKLTTDELHALNWSVNSIGSIMNKRPDVFQVDDPQKVFSSLIDNLNSFADKSLKAMGNSDELQ